MGWQPDVPDRRDLTMKSACEHAQASKNIPKSLTTGAPAQLASEWYENIGICSPVEDQGSLGSCTAHAVSSMLEYVQRRGRRTHVELSRLFLYKVTRKLLGWTGDTGAYLRSTMQAARVFGVAPEEHHPYVVERFEDEPSAFLYSYAANYQTLSYIRLDEAQSDGGATLDRLKQVLKAGFVAAFGFPVYTSLRADGDIPTPGPGDSLRGGHAVLAVGYDDAYVVDGSNPGAVIIQNSWGTNWGVSGFGFLPYDYFREQLALDVWAVFNQKWVDEESFQEGGSSREGVSKSRRRPKSP
jgi:C1A family cysteine protease